MNIKTLEQRKQTNMLIQQSWKNSLKCSKSPAESKAHREVKFWLMDACLQLGLEFHTEATFYKGGRCDFLISDFGLVVEVLDSEKLSDLKKKDYPLPIISLRAEKVVKRDVFSLISDLNCTEGKEWAYYNEKYV